ncbi:MAG: ribonuclease E/G [Halocynthiibacter sp.]
MKGRIVALGQIEDRQAAALIVDGKMQDFLLEANGEQPVLGAIYRATVDRPLKGQGGVMLKLGQGVMGYMRHAQGLSAGDQFLVQVTGYAEDGKAVPVTPKVIFKSRFAIVTPGAKGINISRRIRDEDLRENLLAVAHEILDADGELGLILRSSCVDADPDEITDDIEAMVQTANAILSDGGVEPELLMDGPSPHEMAWRDWDAPDMVASDENAFDNYGVWEEISALKSAHVTLKGAGDIYIEPTRALVAVDVNTKGDMSPAAGLKANLAMARVIPSQLLMRGLSGQITLDLAPMGKKDRRQFEQVLRAAFKADPIDTVLAGFTPLGHYELQRKRERLPITVADLASV